MESEQVEENCVESNNSLGFYKQNEDGSFTVSGKVLDEEIDDYYFESDNFALKENPDYCKLLKALAILESQRARAIQDLDRLIDARQKALADPVAFVEKLQRNEDLELPRLQKIHELPDIDWTKYTTKLDPITHRHMTRNKRVVPGSSSSSAPNVSHNTTVASTSDGRSSEVDSANQVVRGRVFSLGKPQTFNQLWTCEEQRHLERLLVEHPPEEVEARRWEKIANALGNRTPLQVASRVQKYFIKLTKAGLPVPGRIPNVNSYLKRAGLHRHHKSNRLLFSRSTFFTSHEPPVYMSERDEFDDGTMHSNTSSIDGDSSWMFDNDNDYGHNRESLTAEDFKDFITRKNLNQKSTKHSTSLFKSEHKCHICRCSLATGTLWRCIDCPQKSLLVLCNSCYTSPVETVTHRSDHRLESIQQDESMDSNVDEDYASFGDGYYNYLDPNYMPDK